MSRRLQEENRVVWGGCQEAQCFLSNLWLWRSRAWVEHGSRLTIGLVR